MSGLFGAHKATTHATEAMGIDFQGAQYGPVVPVVYGQNKVAGNCVWYGDFAAQAVQQKQGGGKGGGGGSTTSYTYSASYQLGLCDGPNIGLVTVLDGNSVVNLGSINYSFAAGNAGQSPWSHLSGNAALGYSLTSTFSVQNLALGSSPSIPNWNFVVAGLKQYSASLKDANPSDILTDICTDTNHGISFPYLGSLTQYSNYCVANSLLLSPVYDQQQTANQALSDLFKYTNTYVYYSEDQLKVVPLGDTAVTGNGVTFTPNVTPVVNLGTDDFLSDGSGATITIDRKAPQDNLNLVRVEFTDASNTYHDSAVVASIDEDMIVNGGRSDNSETVNGCTNASVARFIAQNLVQRAFYVRNTYQFKLSWRYCYLEPTDIVTLTDASLGLNEFPVRITEIEEDGDSALTITAEEFPEGIGHSAIYNTQPNGGTNIDQNSDPGAVNPPYLFRGPGFLVGNNTPEIWCAVNGSGSLWAACDVYLSHDGTSYTYMGTVASQARYGALTTSLPQGSADPDTTNTPNVQLYAPGQLIGGSQTDADNFVTLAMVDTEIMSYETATLVAANEYKLSYLRRGGYGSANVAHSSGAPWVRLDDSIFRIPVDPSLIGSTVYLKFLSMNCFGRTPRTLAEETAYTYVVGTNVELPDVPNVPASFAVQPIADGVNITWTNDNPAAVGCTSIEYATASAGPFSVLAQEGPTTTSYQHHFTTGATYYYRARARGPLPQSGWSAYTSVISSTGVNVTGTGGLSTTVGNNSTNITVIQASPPKVTNPNFQNLGNGWTPDGSGWTYHNATDFSPNPAFTSYCEFYNGVTNTANRNSACNACQAGDIVTATCQIVGSSGTGSACVRIGWYNASSQEISDTTGNGITGNASGTSRAVGTAPSGAVYCIAEIVVTGYTTGGSGGAYQFSGVTLALQPRSLDEVPNGASGTRNAVSAIDPNNRALIDLSQGGHLNKNLDNIADSQTYLRTVQQSQAETVDNANFESSTSLPVPGWTAESATLSYATSTNAYEGAQSLNVTTTLQYGAAQSNRQYACTAGDVFYVSGAITNTINTGPATIMLLFYNASGVSVGNGGPSSVMQGWHTYSGQVIAPAGSVYFVIRLQNNGVAGSQAWFDIIRVVRVRSLDNEVGDGSTYLRMPGANMDVNRRGLIDFTQSGHLYKHLGNIADDAGSHRYAVASDDVYQSGGYNRIGLRIPGSGHQVGDQRNVPSSLTSNIGIVRSATALTASSSGAVNVNAHTIQLGSASVSYNAVTNAVTGLSQGSSYYIYTNDNYAGGTQTWSATTSATTANNVDGRYNAGLVTIPSSGTSGGGISGGGCVCADMWLRRGLTARDIVKRWRWWRPYMLRGQDGWHFVRQRPRVVNEPCVRITVADGSTLDCSTSTPVTTSTGESVLAPMLYGHFVCTDSGWQRVIEVEALSGLREVVRICVGGHSFFAGANQNFRISTHNVWKE